jgi:hypothetical protein
MQRLLVRPVILVLVAFAMLLLTSCPSGKGGGY